MELKMSNIFKIIMLISGLYCCDVFAHSNEQNEQSYWKVHPKTAKELKLMQGYSLSSDRQITAGNFDRGVNPRWSFLHMTELFPHARIDRAAETIPLKYSMGSLNVAEISFSATDGNEHKVKELLYHTSTDSFLVMYKGSLIHESYYNGMNANTPHLLMSVTKTFTAMLVGILVEQGKLDTKKRVTDYLPELGNTGLTGATVQQVLDMSAALKYSEDYTDLKADVYIEGCVFSWSTPLGCKPGPETFEAYIQTLKEKSQGNGEKFHYRSVLTNVLAMLIERTSGDRMVNMLNKHVWQKLGMVDDGYFNVDSVGFAFAGGGLSATARDVMRFGSVLLNNGQYKGEQIIPEDWIKDTRFANALTKDNFAKGEYGEILPGWHYRNQTWVKDSEEGVMLALGVHGQLIYVNQNTQLVIVKQSSQPEATNLNMFLDTFAALDAISTALALQDKN